MMLFGDVLEVLPPSLTWCEFSFSPAVVSLRHLSDAAYTAHPTLAEYAGSRAGNIVAKNGFDAPWARGRIQHLFGIRQDPGLTIGWSYTADSDKRFNDRSCMHFSFVGNTVINELVVSVPFNCIEGFGRSLLQFGSIPVRNSTTYTSLVSRLACGFWQLLLEDPDNVDDYVDRGADFEKIFEFGIRSGRPFFDWLDP